MLTKQERDGLREAYSIPVWEIIDEIEKIPIPDFLADVQESMIAALDALDNMESDRDRWKSRAESLERAIKQATEDKLEMWSSVVCFTCKGPCDGCENYDLWQFDEARFAATGGKPE